MMASSIIDTVYFNITPIFVAKFYSPSELGLYNRAYGYAMLPSQNISSVIQNVTFPVLSKMQNDNAFLSYNYRRMLKVTAFIIFPMMMMLSALARPLILILITAKWEACIVLLQIICFSLMWYPIHSINLNLLRVKGRADIILRLEIIKKVIGVSILAITLPQGLITFCYGNIVSSMISLIINTYYTGKLIEVGYWRQMKDLLPTLALSLFLFGIIHLTNHFISNLYLQILCGGLIGGIIYLGGALLFKFKELNDIKYITSGHFKLNIVL